MNERPSARVGETSERATLRLFVASPISNRESGLDSTLRRVARRSEGLLRILPQSSRHLTHVFLGERSLTPEDLVDALAPLTGHSPIPLRLGDIRVFPTRGKPRLVCLGVIENHEAVRGLSLAVLDSLRPLLPDLESYRVKPPHVTLARFSRRARPTDARRVIRYLEAGGLTRWSRREVLNNVDLMLSRLDPRGARYTTLSSLRLGGRVAGPSR